MIICPPYYNYICILFQLHKHRVQSTHLNEKSRQIFQSLSWLVSPCRTQANKPKLSFTIVFRNVDSGAKQWAVWAPTTKIQNICPKPGPRMANIRKVTLDRSSRQQQTQNYKTKLSVLVWGPRIVRGCGSVSWHSCYRDTAPRSTIAAEQRFGVFIPEWWWIGETPSPRHCASAYTLKPCQ